MKMIVVVVSDAVTWYERHLPHLGGEFLIPICWNETSTRTAGAGFILRLHGEIKFHSGKVGQFSTCYLFRFVYIFFWFSFLLRRAETITLENFVPAVQRKDPTLLGWNVSHVIARYDLWRVCNTAEVLAKQGRTLCWPTGIMESRT